jgi:hypothetical protein
MLSYLFVGFSFAALASAYQIITPGIADGWTTAGPNTVTWQRVNTDPATFTMVLVNQVSTLLFPLVFPLILVFFIEPGRSSWRTTSPRCDRGWHSK